MQAVVLTSSADRICVGTFKDAKGQAPVLILDLSLPSTPTFGHDSDNPTLGLTQTLPVSGGNVNSLSLTPDDRFLAVGGDDNMVRIAKIKCY